MKITHGQIQEVLAVLGFSGQGERVQRIDMNAREVVIEKFAVDENGRIKYVDNDYPITEVHRVTVKTYRTQRAEVTQAFWKAIHELIDASGGYHDGLVYDGDFITGGNKAMQDRQAEEFDEVVEMIEKQIKIKAGIEE